MSAFQSTFDSLRGFPRRLSDAAREVRRTASLAGAAMLAALSLVLNQFTIAVSQFLEIGFSFLAAGTCAFLYGPWLAGLMGIVTDVAGYFLRPNGGFFPGFTLNEFLLGFLYGCWLYKKPVSLWRTFCACLSAVLVINLVLTPLWLNIMYGFAVFSAESCGNAPQKSSVTQNSLLSAPARGARRAHTMGQKEAIFMLENNNAVLAVVDPVYPGTALQPGSSGSEVARMQTYLNGLRDAKYPTLNRLVVDGRYGSATASTVMQYQVINRLSMDGVIGHDTWNAIVSDYNATIGGSADTYPGIPLRPGDRSQDVRHMQGRLNEVARIYTGINTQTVDGAYGNNMTNAVRRFQRQFSLSADGILGKDTWNKIVSVHNAMQAGNPTHVTTQYPGVPLRVGSTGDYVRFVQSYLNGISGRPLLTVDGNYGQNTTRAVGLFQATAGLPVDGVVGSATWAALIPAFNATL